MNMYLEHTWYEVFMTLIIVYALVSLCTDVIYIVTLIINFVTELKFRHYCKVSKGLQKIYVFEDCTSAVLFVTVLTLRVSSSSSPVLTISC